MVYYGKWDHRLQGHLSHARAKQFKKQSQCTVPLLTSYFNVAKYHLGKVKLERAG